MMIGHVSFVSNDGSNLIVINPERACETLSGNFIDDNNRRSFGSVTIAERDQSSSNGVVAALLERLDYAENYRLVVTSSMRIVGDCRISTLSQGTSLVKYDAIEGAGFLECVRVLAAPVLVLIVSRPIAKLELDALARRCM